MTLDVINYDRTNQDHLSWAIALRDCVRYLIEDGTSTLEALKRLGVSSDKVHINPLTELATVSILDLSEDTKAHLISERQHIKNIRRGA